MKKKSMKKNALLMSIKTTVTLLIPLITYPYVLRVLKVDQLGRYHFSYSIINYFILLAGLGISTYAIREGSKIREDREKISEFGSQIFFFNIISTILSILILVICTIFVPKLQSYQLLIAILGFQILFSTYGRSWIYSIYEEFGFITITQLSFNLISLIALFLFVKSPEDVNKYAIIHVISATGVNAIYGLRVRKYVDFRPVKIQSLKVHIKPVLIIFSTSIATTIYVNSDMTILGWMIDDKCVGLYSVSVKIYSMVKQVMVAVISVAIPRLTLYSNSEKFNKLFLKVFNTLLIIMIPSAVGLFMTSHDIIWAFAGEEYLESVLSLKLLSIALIFALLVNLFGLGVLMPHMKEKIFLYTTIISAIVNIALNFVLIPHFKQNAAAFTTALSEFLTVTACVWYSRKYIDLHGEAKSIMSVIIGAISIVLICFGIDLLKIGLIPGLIIKIVLSAVAYLIVLIILKNIYCLDMINKALDKVKKIGLK